VGVDRHAADRIDGAAGIRRTAAVVAVTVRMIMAAVTVRLLVHTEAHLAV
jgi:hypothetical protein